MNETKAVLFDLDGTLLDTLGDLTDATNYILNKYGYPARSAKEVRSFLGSGAAHLIRSALPCAVEDSVFEKYLKALYAQQSQQLDDPQQLMEMQQLTMFLNIPTETLH